jgi:hypothetical protein
MIQAKRLIYIPFLIFCLCLLGGCAPTATWSPSRFAALEEAFPSERFLDSTAGIPSDSLKKNLFNAPYEDVFRAVSISASQAQMLVEKEDKKGGIILAVRTIQAPPPPGLPDCVLALQGNTRPQQRNYYYAILVKEMGPKSTEVTAVAKAQGRCIDGPCLTGPPAATCHAYASVHWAMAHENSLQELTQLMIFIRNNLIQAGLL